MINILPLLVEPNSRRRKQYWSTHIRCFVARKTACVCDGGVRHIACVPDMPGVFVGFDRQNQFLTCWDRGNQFLNHGQDSMQFFFAILSSLACQKIIPTLGLGPLLQDTSSPHLDIVDPIFSEQLMQIQKNPNSLSTLKSSKQFVVRSGNGSEPVSLTLHCRENEVVFVGEDGTVLWRLSHSHVSGYLRAILTAHAYEKKQYQNLIQIYRIVRSATHCLDITPVSHSHNTSSTQEAD